MIDSSVIVYLARQVAKDGRHHNFTVRTYVDGTQTSKEIDFQTAITEGLPFFVTVKNNILAIDFDSLNGIPLAKEVARLAGIEDRAVIVASGGQGRAHLFTRISTRERAKVAKIAKTLDARERAKNPDHEKIDIRQSIRPPLSPHRHGKHVYLVGMTEGEAISRLDKNLTQERVNRTLAKTEGEGRYKGLYSLACDYVRLNKSEAQYIEDVLANPIGDKARKRQPRNPEAYLRDNYQSAYKEVANERTSNRQEIEAWEAHARQVAKDTGNRNLLTTITEIADIAKRSNKTELSIAVRDILTSTRSTVQGHLSKLQTLKLLITTVPSNRDEMRATTYKLVCEQNGTFLDLSRGGCLPCVSENIRIIEALQGKRAAYRVLEVIAANKGITAREIAHVLNYKTVRSVQIQIKFLIGIGVIEGYGKHYKVARMDNQHLESIAAQRGTIGCIDKRRRQNTRERWQYEESVAAYQELRKVRIQQREAKRQAQRNAPKSSTTKQDPWQPSDWLLPTVRPTPTGGYAYTT